MKPFLREASNLRSMKESKTCPQETHIQTEESWIFSFFKLGRRTEVLFSNLILG